MDRIARSSDRIQRLRLAAIRLRAAFGALLCAALVYLILGGFPPATTTAPSKTAVLGATAIATARPSPSPESRPSLALFPPLDAAVPGRTPTSSPSALRALVSTPSVPTVVPAATSTAVMPLGSPTVTLLTRSSMPSELRVDSQGFGQDKQMVGYAFAVTNTSGLMLTGPTHYTVTVFNAADSQVATASGSVGVVLPLQQQGVAGTFNVPGDSRIARIAVKLDATAFYFPWTKVPLSSATLSYPPDTTSPTVSGVVINRDTNAIDSAVVSAIAYDDAGRIVGGGSTVIGPLASNARAWIDVPTTTSTSPTRVELYAAPRAIPPIH